MGYISIGRPGLGVLPVVSSLRAILQEKVGTTPIDFVRTSGTIPETPTPAVMPAYQNKDQAVTAAIAPTITTRLAWPTARPVSAIMTQVVPMSGEQRRQIVTAAMPALPNPPTVSILERLQQAKAAIGLTDDMMLSSIGSAAVKITAGIDPASVGVNQDGAATTGQSYSIQQPPPATVTVSTDSAGNPTLRSKPASVRMPALPRPLFRPVTEPVTTSVTEVSTEPTRLQTIAKWAVLAVGAWIVYDAFLKKPGSGMSERATGYYIGRHDRPRRRRRRMR